MEYTVPFTFSCATSVKVRADSPKEAAAKAKRMVADNEIPLFNIEAEIIAYKLIESEIEPIV